MKLTNRNFEATCDYSDIVNPDSFDRDGKAFVILSAGYVQAVVFSEYTGYCEQDAIDEAVDSGKLDHFQVSESELSDYEIGTDSEGIPEYEGLEFLGNASEPFDIEGLDIWIFPASIFEEMPELMTFDRIMTQLEDRLYEAHSGYDKVSTNDPNWSAAYQAKVDAEDAITLFRLMCNHLR